MSNQDELPYKRRLKATKADLAREQRQIRERKAEELKARGIKKGTVKIVKKGTAR